MSLRAGELNERIDLQKKNITRDTLNAEVVTWVTVYPREPAKVEAITGREVHAASQLHASMTLRVTIRVKPNVNAEWRALWNDAPLSIGAVLPVPARDRVWLLCSQGLNQG